MKKVILLILILNFSKTYSQKEFYDFIITENNDTIYGTINTSVFKKLVLREKNKSGESRLKYLSHPIWKTKSFRYNNKVFSYDESYGIDSIYRNKVKNDSNYYYDNIDSYVNKTLKLREYIVTIENDTIFGEIFEPAIGKPYLIDSSNNDYTIDTKKVKSFRFRNQKYFNLSHIKRRYKFMELLVDGDAKLYFQKNRTDLNSALGLNNTTNIHSLFGTFCIQKNGDLVKINELGFKKQMVNLFSKNKDLIDKVLNDEYTYSNLILIVKFFNEQD